LSVENHRLFHANAMTPFHDATQAEVLKGILEPAYMEHEIVRVIESPTLGCRHHAHYFYGSRNACERLGDLLGNLQSWLKEVPSGLLPDYQLPSSMSPTDQNLVLWANIVYFLAWDFDLWYLDAAIEFQDPLNAASFWPWEDFKKPADANPCPFLTHEKSAQGTFEPWSYNFQRQSCRLPDVIDAYLIDVGENICGEFLRASIAATDIIVGLLDSRGREGQTSSPRSIPRRKPTRRRVKKVDAIESDKFSIIVCLLKNHIEDRNPKTCRVPMTQEDIATQLGWISEKTGRPLQKRVHDRMKELFPSGGHRFYRNCFTNDGTCSRFLKELKRKVSSKRNIQLSDEEE